MQDQDDAARRWFDWPKWIALFAAASFTIYGIDVAINHTADARTLMFNPLAYTPLVFAPLAVLACLAAVFSAKARPRIALVTGLLAVIVGATGFFLHVSQDLRFLQRSADTPWREVFGPEGLPPFAPAAFAATGILVLLIWLDDWIRHRKGNAS